MDLKIIELKQDRNLFVLVIIIGMILNFMVVSLNNNQMPVKADSEYQDSFYFSYQNNSEVKLWILTDWIGFDTENNAYRFSLGDIVMMCGVIGIIFYLIKFIRLIIKNEL